MDAALAGQNTLLAAESLGYGGVIIGLVRYKSEEVAELFNLPDYTYPVFGIALGVPDQQHDVKPRLPLNQVVFEEEYQEQPVAAILTMTKYRQTMLVRVRQPLGVSVWQSSLVKPNLVQLGRI